MAARALSSSSSAFMPGGGVREPAAVVSRGKHCPAKGEIVAGARSRQLPLPADHAALRGENRSVELVSCRVLAVIPLHAEWKRRVRGVFRRQFELHAIDELSRRTEFDRFCVGAALIFVGVS